MVPEGARFAVTVMKLEDSPRNIRASSMMRIGKYTAGTMMANASGNAASKPTMPRMSQVSLPSQIGAMEFISKLRACRFGAKL